MELCPKCSGLCGIPTTAVDQDGRKVPDYDPCEVCNARGWIETKCPICKSIREYTMVVAIDVDEKEIEVYCPTCKKTMIYNIIIESRYEIIYDIQKRCEYRTQTQLYAKLIGRMK
jgi:phage FluMu protein Com